MRTIGANGPADGNAVSGELIGGSAKAPATFGAGRVCEEPGCTTRLSVYNSRTRCSVHDFDASLMNFRCATPPERPAARTGTATTTTGARIARVPTARRSAKRPAARAATRHAA